MMSKSKLVDFEEELRDSISDLAYLIDRLSIDLTSAILAMKDLQEISKKQELALIAKETYVRAEFSQTLDELRSTVIRLRERLELEKPSESS